MKFKNFLFLLSLLINLSSVNIIFSSDKYSKPEITNITSIIEKNKLIIAFTEETTDEDGITESDKFSKPITFQPVNSQKYDEIEEEDADHLSDISRNSSPNSLHSEDENSTISKDKNWKTVSSESGDKIDISLSAWTEDQSTIVNSDFREHQNKLYANKTEEIHSLKTSNAARIPITAPVQKISKKTIEEFNKKFTERKNSLKETNPFNEEFSNPETNSEEKIEITPAPINQSNESSTYPSVLNFIQNKKDLQNKSMDDESSHRNENPESKEDNDQAAKISILEADAIKIQALARGYITRKKTHESNPPKIYNKIVNDSHDEPNDTGTRNMNHHFDEVDQEDHLGKFIVSCVVTLNKQTLDWYKQLYLQTEKTIIGNPIAPDFLEKIKAASTFYELDAIVKEINEHAKKA